MQCARGIPSAIHRVAYSSSKNGGESCFLTYKFPIAPRKSCSSSKSPFHALSCPKAVHLFGKTGQIIGVFHRHTHPIVARRNRSTIFLCVFLGLNFHRSFVGLM